MTGEQLPEIAAVRGLASGRLEVTWRSGRRAEVQAAQLPGAGRLPPLEEACVEPWGHAVTWPDGTELGADSLWLASLTAWGDDDARAFLEWRLKHALSTARAAEALGVRRGQVIAWSTGAKPVPRAIMLACRGWESLLQAA